MNQDVSLDTWSRDLDLWLGKPRPSGEAFYPPEGEDGAMTTSQTLLFVGAYCRRSDGLKYQIHRVDGTQQYTLTVGGEIVASYASKNHAHKAASAWPF